MNKSLVLTSGGLDSTVLFTYVKHGLKEETTPLFFRYSQPFLYQETSALKKVLSREDYETLVEMYLPAMKPTDGEFIPQRNLVFLSVALNYAETNGYDKIYAGFIDVSDGESGREYFDTSKPFVELVQKMTDRVEIITPFINKTKWDVIALGEKLEVDMVDTWSCNFVSNFTDKPCGECGNCEIRKIAFGNVPISPV